MKDSTIKYESKSKSQIKQIDNKKYFNDFQCLNYVNIIHVQHQIINFLMKYLFYSVNCLN
jgi:hypothetical protein